MHPDCLLLQQWMGLRAGGFYGWASLLALVPGTAMVLQGDGIGNKALLVSTSRMQNVRVRVCVGKRKEKSKHSSEVHWYQDIAYM